jgi:uncharacterized protein HemX
MPEEAVSVISAIVSGLFGVGGVVAYYRARTERLHTLADVRKAATTSTTEAWQTLTQSLQERLAMVTDRLCEVERQLEMERNKRTLLEAKIRKLEGERDQWILERQRLILQIAEIGGGNST